MPTTLETIGLEKAIRLKRASNVFGRMRNSLCAVLIGASSLHAAAPAHSLVNKQAPSFVRADLTGKQIDLDDYRGKVVLLNFWATWCAPCQVELPRFAEWQKEYETDGLQIIAVSMDDDAAPVRKTASKLKLNFPVIMGDEKLGAQYGRILGLPVTYLIARDGTIRAKFKGEADLRVMEKHIKKLLANH